MNEKVQDYVNPQNLLVLSFAQDRSEQQAEIFKIMV